MKNVLLFVPFLLTIFLVCITVNLWNTAVDSQATVSEIKELLLSLSRESYAECSHPVREDLVGDFVYGDS